MKLISTKVEWQMLPDGQMVKLSDDAKPWYGPVAECKSKKTEGEKKGFANSEADRASREGLVAKNEATLGQFDGPAEKSPYYRSRLNSGIRATSRAFEDVRREGRLAGRARGFGYESPVAQGNELGIAADEASALGELPNQALEDTTNRQMQSADLRAGEAGMYSGSAGGNFSTAANAENQRLARRSAMWRSIISAGTGVATSFIPGSK
jgi:hypothetical protein